MKINDGDVFFWSWKHIDPISQQAGTSYWCMDQQCVAREVSGEIVLIDTYNYNEHLTKEIFGLDGFRGEYVKYLDIAKVDLSFRCNVNDMRVEKYQKDDYDKFYDLSYQKGYSKLFVVKGGAERSTKAIIAKKLKEKEQLEGEVAYSLKKIQWLTEEIEELEEE